MITLAAMLMAAEAFSAPLNLPKPARIDMTVERTREDVRGGQTKSASTVTRYEKTIEPNGEGYRVTLKASAPTFPAGGPRPDIPDAMMAVLQDSLSYTADDSLKPWAFNDWPGMMTRIREATAPFAKGDAEAARAFEAMISIFGQMSPSQAASLLLREDAFLSTPINAALDVGKPQTNDMLIPNPLGGPPIKAKAALTLQSADRANGVATLRWTSELDPESTRDSLSKSIQALATQAGADGAKPDLQKTFAKLKLERSSSCVYKVDTRSGLPTKADCEARLAVSDPSTGDVGQRNERWIITQTLKN